jgi:tRNA threonylcarbamoyl adenosine modification protein YjeE
MSDISGIFRAEAILADLPATQALAARIAPLLRPGDAVALWGELGSGKTTLARAILRALGVTEDVPSPTFTIVQTYDTNALTVAHLDLYRLKRASELEQLGFSEMLDEGAVLVEWPERAPEYLPDTALHVRLTLSGEARNAKFTGPSRWAEIV